MRSSQETRDHNADDNLGMAPLIHEHLIINKLNNPQYASITSPIKQSSSDDRGSFAYDQIIRIGAVIQSKNNSHPNPNYSRKSNTLENGCCGVANGKSNYRKTTARPKIGRTFH